MVLSYKCKLNALRNLQETLSIFYFKVDLMIIPLVKKKLNLMLDYSSIVDKQVRFESLPEYSLGNRDLAIFLVGQAIESLKNSNVFGSGINIIDCENCRYSISGTRLTIYEKEKEEI